MPELPEVETVARLIRPRLEGRRIEGARVLWRRSLGGVAPAAFERAVAGARIARVGRRGKFCVLELERGGAGAGAILVHLRMTGRLYVEPAGARLDPCVRVACALEGGERLDFLDVRKLGRFLHAPDPAAVLGRLGPEPLGPEFTADWLHAALASRRRMLKPLLLDQGFVAGLGNIYVDESLWTAGLHPRALSSGLRRPRTRLLHGAIRSTLAAAIEREGSSFDRFYRTPEGRPGGYQDQFRAYGRAGLPCGRCGRPIRRIVVGQRGTWVCTRCQRAPRASSPSKKSSGAMTTSSTTVRHLKASPNPPIRLRFQTPHRGGCRRPGIQSTSSTDC